MLLALDPEADWNNHGDAFLREHANLVIVLVTDEEDCSVRTPDGYAYFVDPMQDTYWEVNPDTGTKTHATSAVCWNAGVDCGAPDANGIYADCSSIDTGVLHPVQRYLSYDPTAGGVFDLVYRQWVDGMWPAGDIIEQGETAASKEFEYGIGPGCTGEDGMGGVTGQAIPPVRIKEVCEGLDEEEKLRCCIHSVCDGDYSNAFRSLGGMIQMLYPATLLPL